MIIPGFLISLLTFPGVIVHEFAHRLFADLTGVPVYKVCYFRLGNPAGYVIHGPVNGVKKAFLISVGPMIINTLLCALITFPAVIPLFILKDDNFNPILILLAWVGFSIGMHAFPSNEDMNNLTEEIKKADSKGLLGWLAKGFGLFFRLANALRFFWFDAIYAFGVSMILPTLFGLT